MKDLRLRGLTLEADGDFVRLMNVEDYCVRVYVNDVDQGIVIRGCGDSDEEFARDIISRITTIIPMTEDEAGRSYNEILPLLPHLAC